MIPVHEPYLGEEEAAAALRRDEISGSFGESIPAFDRWFAHYVGAEQGMYIPCGIDLNDDVLGEIVDTLRAAAGVPT